MADGVKMLVVGVGFGLDELGRLYNCRTNQ